MTYEHAKSVTASLAGERIFGYCVPASLDALMGRTVIDQFDYLEFMRRQDEALSEEADGEHTAHHQYLADRYFQNGIVLGGVTTGEWVVEAGADPFNPSAEEYPLAKPKREHLELQSILDEVLDPDLEIDTMLSREKLYELYRMTIGLFIVIDNALDRGLTVLGESDNHTFGIGREADGRHFIYDTSAGPDGVQGVIEKLGPYTLKEILGLPETDRHAEMPEPNRGCHYPFEVFDDEYGKYFGIRLYPPEQNNL